MKRSHKDMANYKQQNLRLKIRAVLVLPIIFLVLSPISSAYASEINESNLFEIINRERRERNLSELKINADLKRAATLKSKDMVNRNYFEHYYNGRTPWDFMAIAGYDYAYAGENLAMDFQTSEGAVKTWMNSPAHRDNILNPEYEETGLGVVRGTYIENGQAHTTVMITNMFGKRKSVFIKALESIKRLIPLY